MKIGDRMLCDQLDLRTGEVTGVTEVEILKISRDHETQEPVSARVSYVRKKGGTGYIWVQVRYLHELPGAVK